MCSGLRASRADKWVSPKVEIIFFVKPKYSLPVNQSVAEGDEISKNAVPFLSLSSPICCQFASVFCE